MTGRARRAVRQRLDMGAEVALCAVVRRESDPARLAQHAAHDSWRVRRAAVENEHCPQAVIASLGEDWSYGVRAAVATRLASLGDWEGRLLRDHDAVRRALAQRTDLTAGTFERLAGDFDEEVRLHLADNPALPSRLVTSLLGDTEYSVRAKVVASGRLSAADLRTLVRREPHLAYKASQARYAPYDTDMLLAFCAHPNKWVRCNVVDRPDCPVEVLRVLAEDPDVEVRARVAAHRNADEDVLTVSALSRSEKVRLAVRNRDGGAAWLIGHRDVDVRVAATKVIPSTAAEYAALLVDRSERVRAAAVHGSLPVWTLQKMAEDPSALVRGAVAKAACTPGVLAVLAADAERTVRRAVAANRHTAPAVLAVLADDSAAVVRKAAGESFLAHLAAGPSA